MTETSSFEFRVDTANPERYTLLQKHIQQKILRIQSLIKQDPSHSSNLVEILKGYIALKNVGIEARRHLEIK